MSDQDFNPDPLSLMRGVNAADRLSGGEPFRFSHNLHLHPAFELDTLADLAAGLPGDRVEYNSENYSPHQDPDQTPGISLAPQDVVKQIDNCGAWMVLKNIELEPAYRNLLHTFLARLAADAGHSTLAAAGMSDIQGSVYIASAQSVTPFHADYEENLFLHLRGRKIFHLFDNRDRDLVSDADLEAYPGKHRNLAYDDKFFVRGVHHFLKPGSGLYVPHIWPHWVETGDEVAISIAISWKTKEVRRFNDLVAANSFLRKYGFPQSPPGESPNRDAAKAACVRVVRTALSPLQW